MPNSRRSKAKFQTGNNHKIKGGSLLSKSLEFLKMPADERQVNSVMQKYGETETDKYTLTDMCTC